MIRIEYRRADDRLHIPASAKATVGGTTYTATDGAAIYKLVTALWLDGHAGERWEAFDDRDPWGGPGGCAMRGVVRNYARTTAKGVSFDPKAKPAPDFTADEARRVMQAAAQIGAASSAQARVCATQGTDGQHPRSDAGAPVRAFSPGAET